MKKIRGPNRLQPQMSRPTTPKVNKLNVTFVIDISLETHDDLFNNLTSNFKGYIYRLSLRYGNISN